MLKSINSELDIIIDDGSHINEHVIRTFQYLFPKLKPGGIYVVEDTQTSYRQDYGGDDKNLNNDKELPIHLAEYQYRIGKTKEFLENVKSYGNKKYLHLYYLIGYDIILKTNQT